MTKEEYRAALAKLKRSQEDMGRRLKLSPRTSQNYATGKTPIPGPVELLLKWKTLGIEPDL
jgi:beta-phosphoglucomutase-like phosphatase (HAD superfamily)